VTSNFTDVVKQFAGCEDSVKNSSINWRLTDTSNSVDLEFPILDDPFGGRVRHAHSDEMPIVSAEGPFERGRTGKLGL